MSIFFHDIVLGMRRRIKEIRLMIAVVSVSMVFMCGMFLFQKNSESYKYEHNRLVYGDWSIAELYKKTEGNSQKLKDHRYFDRCGVTISGVPIIGRDGNKVTSIIGYMDEAMLEIGNITLNDGRFPENTDEIVMETGTLAELGYSFDIGQEIQLKVPDSEGKLTDKTYKLVGVLKNNTALWTIGASMPSALIVKDELDSMKFNPTTIYCYHIKDKYKKINITHFYESLIKAYNPDNREGQYIEYNEFLYLTSFWGIEEIYGFIEKLILLAGLASISFLLAAYIQKRKKYYYRLRTIGMSKMQVRFMIFAESAYICLPWMAAAIAVTIAVGAIIVLGISVVNGFTYFYEVPLKDIGKVALMGFVIFVMSTLIAMIATSGKRLYENHQMVSMRFLFKCFC